VHELAGCEHVIATTQVGPPALPEIQLRPFERSALRQRLGAFAFVALAAEASLALPPGPKSALDTILSIALLVLTGLLITLRWEYMPAWATVLVPVTYAGSVMMLVLAAGGPNSGTSIVVLIPLVWTALYHRRWESAVVVAAIVAVEIVTSLTPLGEPPGVIIRRVVFWGTIGALVSLAVHGLRHRLRTMFTERERLHAAHAESLRRMIALELAAEELASSFDAYRIIVTASRHLSEFVSPTLGAARNAAYLRVAGGVAQFVARHDEAAPPVTSYPLSEHPRLELAALTGEVNHGSIDIAALGPTIGPWLQTLGYSHGVYVPVKVEGVIDGVFAISMRGSEPSRELVEQCKAVGHLTELALGNAILHGRERDLAMTDALTGLANRRAFEALMEQRPGRGAFAMIVIDLDGLKEINDSKGHLAGDALLQATATALASVMPRGDVLARIGGDEFAVLCFDSDLVAAQDLALRMLDALRQSPIVGVTPKASIGIASGASEDDTLEIFRAADAAMYRAKRDGGERVGVGEPVRR